jgi:HTH-type transcriptional regulator/antitoxin HigA
MDVLEADVLRFLGVKSLEERQPLAFAAKQTAYHEELSSAQEVWLLRVKQLAETMTVAKYSEAKLLFAVDQLRGLLRSPDEARHVPRILAEAGVRFVIVEQLPGLKVDGVCFGLSPTKPVIGMSLVRDRIDNFWFVLRHEIEHVLNGDGNDGAIVDNDLDHTSGDVSEQERRANAAAANFCVPQADMEDFMARKGPLFTDDNIRRFAQTIQVHPGLVAGQLRQRQGKWNLYTKHLAKVRHVVVSTALVDGFGSAPQVGA